MPAFSVTNQALTTCTVHLPQSRNVLPPRDYLLVVLDIGVPPEAVLVALDLKLVLYRGVTGLMKLAILIVETFWHSGEQQSQDGRMLE